MSGFNPTLQCISCCGFCSGSGDPQPCSCMCCKRKHYLNEEGKGDLREITRRERTRRERGNAPAWAEQQKGLRAAVLVRQPGMEWRRIRQESGFASCGSSPQSGLAVLHGCMCRATLPLQLSPICFWGTEGMSALSSTQETRQQNMITNCLWQRGDVGQWAQKTWHNFKHEREKKRNKTWVFAKPETQRCVLSPHQVWLWNHTLITD